MNTVISKNDIEEMNLTKKEKWLVQKWADDYAHYQFNSIRFMFRNGTRGLYKEHKSAWRKFITWTVKDFCKTHESGTLDEYCKYVAFKFGAWDKDDVRMRIKEAAINNPHITATENTLEYIKQETQEQ